MKNKEDIVFEFKIGGLGVLILLGIGVLYFTGTWPF